MHVEVTQNDIDVLVWECASPVEQPAMDDNKGHCCGSVHTQGTLVTVPALLTLNSVYVCVTVCVCVHTVGTKPSLAVEKRTQVLYCRVLCTVQAIVLSV